MKTYGNQKMLTINKETVEKESGKKRPYMVAYRDTLQMAAADLKNSAFKVYIYLISNQNAYYSGLSPQAIANSYGISIDAARDGIKQLCEKGYIEKVGEEGNEYIFYDRLDRKPVELAEEIEMNEEKKWFHKKDGTDIQFSYGELVAQYGVEKAENLWKKGRTEK